MAWDIEQPGALIAWLQAGGHLERNEEPRVQVLSGGVSNRTVLVERRNGERWVLKQALAKLRVAADWFSPPDRVHREALGMRWLNRLTPAGTVPRFLFEDFDHHLVAMEAVPQPHANWKDLLLAGQVEEDAVRQFGQLLGGMHARSHEEAAQVSVEFEDRTYFESLRLEPFYAYTAGRLPEAAPFLHALMAETRTIRTALVHGDFSPKNILVHRGRLVWVDHEVIHWGDPAFDVGFALAHLLSKAHALDRFRSALLAAALQFVASYARARNHGWLPAEETRSVRHALGCLLARAAGRSPVEYLDPAARLRQGALVLACLHTAAPPRTVSELVELWRRRLADAAPSAVPFPCPP